jgi:hypothetical protein
MKRFLVFAGDTYYPAGGWGDFVSDHDTADEATVAAMSRHADWREVIDTETGDDVLDPIGEVAQNATRMFRSKSDR